MKKYSYVYALWAAIFIVFPIILIFMYSFNGSSSMGFENFEFSLANYKSFFEPLYLKILGISVGVALLSTVVCLLIGYPVAYIIANLKPSIRQNVILLFIIPMWMNFLLRTYAWLTILGNNGLLNKAFALIGLGPFDLMYNMNAVMIGMIYNFLPFMVLPIYTILLKIDKNLLDAASDLGANKFKVFTKVILPLSLPGVYTGITMVFIPAISTFVISNLLGGHNIYLIGNLIDQQFSFTGNWGFGSAVSMILIFILLIIMGVNKIFDKNHEGGNIF
ncbi:ABC transporter permease [Peptoniphilus indolicus]|uniref:Spermidine/putrescine ABC superfamily ATP binding cassette transporter, permease protein n=2 Tax=Peptoniphilus indolicus TaxID=33030 RepID=G4D5B2_9FIRM|nr:ABC transporter permease [Peptoniphilus indolicus]EGY79228.1 spermidine/putrescine ABC superfamily ATP binding cassette transporter, permease protein [Peptoniphilus indolicus ATCC 29427]SUB74330.1 Spermidine/putrescine transport system permease protein PotB [Peptoniphilus indolicus]